MSERPTHARDAARLADALLGWMEQRGIERAAGYVAAAIAGVALVSRHRDQGRAETLAAIGRAASDPGRTSALEDTGEPPVRARRALSEILWPIP